MTTSTGAALRRIDGPLLALIFAAALGLGLLSYRDRDRGPQIHDELAYVFQARLLLGGHLSAPSPPLPEFFEAAHLLVVPRFASKYLPGHALALAPFVALGAPWLWPVLALGLAVCALYLSLRWSGVEPGFAAGGALLFLCSSSVTRAWLTLLSHSTAALCVALALAAAARLRRQRPSIGLAVLLAAAAGQALLTRPFAGVALFAAAGLAVAIFASFRHLLAFAATAAAAGAAVLLCCQAVTGRPLETPWTLYARQYMPFDGPGIGKVVAPPPERTLPPHLEPLATSFRFSRELHTRLRLGMAISRRSTQLLNFSPSVLLVPLALFAASAGPAAVVAAAFIAAFFGLQLLFHASSWYYLLEAWPALAFLIAAGAARLASLCAGWPRYLRFAARSWLALAAVHALANVLEDRAGLYGPWLGTGPLVAQTEALLEPVRQARGLVFLRYPKGWDANVDLTYNDPDLERATIVRALDLGERNPELRRRFPSRPAFLLDLGTKTLLKLP